MIKYFDNLGDQIAYNLAQFLVQLHIKPLWVTIFRFVVAAPISWYLFSSGQYRLMLLGLIIYIALAFLDIVDGDMAKMYKLPKRTAPFGKFVDHSLDRVLMLIVLGALLYSGSHRDNNVLWWGTIIGYYSSFFLITTMMYEFDRTFSLNIQTYPKLEKKIKNVGANMKIKEKILYNLLYVHNNTFTRIFFTHNFLLIFGIVTFQILPLFIYFTFMHTIRAIGLFIIEYQTLNMKPTTSVLSKTLRDHLQTKA